MSATRAFQLVHCGFAGGWTWQATAAELRRRGYLVHAPTLTGLGERAHLARPETNLDTHVQDLVAVVECEAIDRLTIVASSSGSMAATGMADRLPGRIERLVYIDTLVPQNGQSWMDLLGPAVAAPLLEAARLHGDGWRVSRSGVKPGRWTPQRLASVTQPIRLRSSATVAFARHYAQCTARPAGWFFGLGDVIDHEAARLRGAG
jgi:pimeloyl-ACP methyl ester carboxylesterase